MGCDSTPSGRSRGGKGRTSGSTAAGGSSAAPIDSTTGAVSHAAAILHEEGFAVHHRKTRIMRQGVCQRLAGLVANQRLNVPRADFDNLKATLTNCIRHGLESQNRAAHPAFRAHLEGRVGFVESINPVRGARLRALLQRIP